MWYVFALTDAETDDLLYLGVTSTPDRYRCASHARLTDVQPKIVLLAECSSQFKAKVKKRIIQRKIDEEMDLPMPDLTYPPIRGDVVKAIRELIGR